MSLTGKILFANNVSNIFSGDDIVLIVEIENLVKVFVKEIFLSFRGEIIVKWKDLINKNKDGKIVYIMQDYEDQQTVLDKHITLQTMDVINKGKYHYDVLINIPHELPQSVSRKYGAVKYELKLCVYYTQGIEVLCKMPIDVKRNLNICLHKEYLRPFHTVFRKSFCWGICNTQPIKVILTVPNTSIIAGDSIKYLVKIENFSKLLDLQRLSVILTQTHHYKAFKPKPRTKQVHTTLNQIMHFFNENHHKSKLEGSLQLPQSLVASSPNTCCISTSYNLHFIMVFTGLQTDGYISLPIIIRSHKTDSEKMADFTTYETKLQIEHDKLTEYEV